jgi:GTP-binding protein
MSKKIPIIAIVGRANVGKSSLFNSILRRREAIVAQEAGTTRDSVWAKASYNDQDFWIVDTAGMKEAADDFEFTIQEQIQQASDSADVIWVVIESDVIISDEDRRIAKLALRTNKPVFLVVNKADKLPQEIIKKAQNDLGDDDSKSIYAATSRVKDSFKRLGIKTIHLTCCTQNAGIRSLLDSLIAVIPEAHLQEADDRIRIALLGRPNVGKSALFNSLAKKQQAIVADRAGTTRDINRTIVRYEGREIEIMDTAGIRRSGKIERGIEKFSVIRAISAIEQADICLMLMDAQELNVALDQKIAGMIKEAGRGLVLVVSKWDTLKSKQEAAELEAAKSAKIMPETVITANEKPPKLTKEEKKRRARAIRTGEPVFESKDAFTRDAIAAQIAHTYDFVPWAPLILTSSVTGQNVTKLFDLALDIHAKRQQTYKTTELNRWLRKMIDQHPPAGLKNRAPKLNYMVHEEGNPIPSFKIFGSHTKFLHWSYKRYLERNFREQFDLTGTALKFWFIEKHDTHKHGTRPTRD